MAKANYANLAVTAEDHAAIDIAMQSLLVQNAQRGGAVADELVDRNPANPNQIVACFSQNGVDARYVAELFRNAHTAQMVWRAVPFRERIVIIRQWAANIEARLYKFIAAMVLETGKPRGEAKAEACEAVDLIRYYCDQYAAANGYTIALTTSSGALANTLVYQPWGVFVGIAPFNFPLALLVGMSTGALLTGNTMVFKPSPDAPLTGVLLQEAFVDACARTSFALISRDVFGCVVCADSAFEQGMVRSRKLIAGLAFTGSKAVGLHLKRLLESREPTPNIIGEFGGKNHCIVTPSVASLEAMTCGVARSAFGHAGQKCSALSVLVVPKSMQHDVVAAVARATEALFVMGNPAEHDVTLGPLINERAHERYWGVRHALAETGAVVTVPAIRKKRCAPNGYYADPIIVSGLPANHPFHYDELFMPVLCVRTYGGAISEAVEIANSTKYGLTAGLFSANQNEIVYFLDNMAAGVLYVNREAGATTGAWPGEQPFGGWNGSGSGARFPVCGPHFLFNFVRSQSRTVYA